MSIDEEFENILSDVPLLIVLESRNECLNQSEVWAILKETCVSLRPLENTEGLKMDINCLIIDSSGNIKVNFEKCSNIQSPSNISQDKGSLINSLGEIFKYIIVNYSDVSEDEELSQYIDQLLLAHSEERFSVHKIELYADRQLNGSSVDVLYHEFISSKKSEELSSEFQDSFLSTEYSVDTAEDTDTDQSICITKDLDTSSVLSEGKSFDNSEDSKYFVCLNQLWSHSMDPVFKSDQECIVFIYVILKEISNILINENNFKKCLCISKENVFLNPLGQMLLNFSFIYCDSCGQERDSIKYYDTKYINTVGTMLYNVIQSDNRVHISDQVVLLLQRMKGSTDMTINDILDFCKGKFFIQASKCRTVLKSLFVQWNYWFNVHLHYLMNLKHKYLYEISTKNFKEVLKPTPRNPSMDVRELFQQNPLWIKELKYVTKLSQTLKIGQANDIQEIPSSSISSAFRRYPTSNPYVVLPPLVKPARIKTNTHFRPLIFTSESSSIHRSQNNMFSPIDVTPKLSDVLQNKTEIPFNSSKSWKSMNYLPQENINNEDCPQQIRSTSFQRASHSKCERKSSLMLPCANRSSKVNLIIDVIEAVLSKSFTAKSEEIGNRHLLEVADFAFSLGRLSKSIFFEAMKQRFIHIRWSNESLEQLYDIIGTKDIYTPPSSYKSSERNSKETTSHSKEDFTITLANKSQSFKEVNDDIDESSSGSSKTSSNSESFEDIERQCASILTNEPLACDYPRKSIEISFSKIGVNMCRQESVKKRNREDSSDISDFIRNSGTPILPNKLQSTNSIQPCEDSSFYQQIFPTTLLCFHSTLAYANQPAVITADQIISPNKIQELLFSFEDVNRTIRYKFKELSKTIDRISKCDDDNKNDRKIKKRFIADHKELQLGIESLILSEMKLENTIVEFHSVNLETILEEIKSSCAKQSIVFSNEVRTFQNLQFVRPLSLVTCLFARGAVSSGLLHDFFLVYREFFKPQDFIENLNTAFNNIERKLRNGSSLVTKARFRLLYIVLCWIEGFYDIDINNGMLARIKEMAHSNLIPFIKNTNQLIETAVATAKSSKTALSIQFTALNKKTNLSSDIIHNVDIGMMVSDINKKEKDKGKLFAKAPINLSQKNSLGNQDTFSIFNISPKDLAVCLTLIQQTYFDCIHPCHLLLYLRSLSNVDESILNSINKDKFPTRSSQPNNTLHKEIRAFLLLSGHITHWAISEILLTTDVKLQAKIVKKLVLTCHWLKELNNYGSMTSVIEALTSDKLKWAPFWAHISGKITKLLKDVTCTVGKLFNSTSRWPDGHETSSNALLSGVAFLPCIHAILVHLKMSSFGNCVTREGCLKWTKLRKLSKILDQIRLYKQFRYTSSDSYVNDLRLKLQSRIEHLTSISLGIQSS